MEEEGKNCNRSKMQHKSHRNCKWGKLKGIAGNINSDDR